MIFPFFTIACEPGIDADPSVLQAVFSSTESPEVLNFLSHTWKVRRSNLIQSLIFGVSIVIDTGFEKIKCELGIPNSNPSTCASLRFFFCTKRFLIFFSNSFFAFPFFMVLIGVISIVEASMISPLDPVMIVPEAT